VRNVVAVIVVVVVVVVAVVHVAELCAVLRGDGDEGSRPVFVTGSVGRGGKRSHFCNVLTLLTAAAEEAANATNAAGRLLMMAEMFLSYCDAIHV
jgi:hypothetical protein